MRVTDILEIESPVFVCLICQVLRFARYRIDLTACSPDLFNNTCFHIAP